MALGLRWLVQLLQSLEMPWLLLKLLLLKLLLWKLLLRLWKLLLLLLWKRLLLLLVPGHVVAAHGVKHISLRWVLSPLVRRGLVQIPRAGRT